MMSRSFLTPFAVIALLLLAACGGDTAGDTAEIPQETPREIPQEIPQLTVEQIAENRAEWYCALLDRGDVDEATFTRYPYMGDKFTVVLNGPPPLTVEREQFKDWDGADLRITSEYRYLLAQGPFGPTVTRDVCFEMTDASGRQVTVSVPITFQLGIDDPVRWPTDPIPLPEQAGKHLLEALPDGDQTWQFTLKIPGTWDPRDLADHWVRAIWRGDVPQTVNVISLQDLPEFLEVMVKEDWDQQVAAERDELLETYEVYQRLEELRQTEEEWQLWWSLRREVWKQASVIVEETYGPRPNGLADVSVDDLAALTKHLVFVIFVCPEAVNGINLEIECTP